MHRDPSGRPLDQTRRNPGTHPHLVTQGFDQLRPSTVEVDDPRPGRELQLGDSRIGTKLVEVRRVGGEPEQGAGHGSHPRAEVMLGQPLADRLPGQSLGVTSRQEP